MRTRGLVRGQTAAVEIRSTNFASSSLRKRRSALLAGAALGGLVAGSAPAWAVPVNSQAGFDTQIVSATTTGLPSTIDLTIPDNTGTPPGIIRITTSINLPGAANPLTLNVGASNTSYSGTDDTATLAVTNGATLGIGPGTSITFSPSQTSLLRFNVADGLGAGTVNMTGGQLTFVPHNAVNPNQYSFMVIGRNAHTGVFNQSGGDVELGATTVIGTDGATGTYTVSNNATLGIATTTEANAGYFFIGYNQGPLPGTGTLHVTDSAQVTLDDYIRLNVGSARSGGGFSSGNGLILQDGAGSKVTFTGEEFIFGSFGPGGTGTYQLDAGTLIVNPTTVFNPTPVQFGSAVGATGKFLQNGGTFTTNADARFGNDGTGVYNLTAGSATFSNGMTIAANGGSTGTVTQTGGTLTVSGGQIKFGSGTGAYNLSGGTLVIGGNNITGTGAFRLGGGTIQVAGSALTTSSNATLVHGTTSTIDTSAFNATWDGALLSDGAGTANLTKTGANTLTLTNSGNNYTGTTTVTGGKFALANAGMVNSSSSIVLANDAIFDISLASGSRTILDLTGTADTSVNLGVNGLTFGGAASTTFDGDFTGPSGKITKQGTGKFTFGGTSSSIGDVTINGGTLATTHMNAFSLSLVSMGSGTTWDLTGAGSQNLKQLSIAGATSHLVMTLGNGHDVIHSSTGITLNGTLDIKAGDGNFTPTTTPTVIISSALGRSGSFLNWTDDLDFLDATVVYPGNDVALTWAANGTTFQSIGTTPNQQAAGAAIYALGLGNGNFNAVATHNGAAALAVIDQLSGDFHASTKDALTYDSLFLAGAAGERLDGLNTANGGGGADLPVGVAAAANGGLWLQGYGRTVSLADGSGNAGDVTGTHYGALAGLEGGSGDWAGGLAGGVSRAALASASRNSNGTVNNVDLLAYLGGEAGNVDVRAGATYSFNAISTTRTVLSQTLTASYSARTAQAFGEIGADMGMFEPFAGANYINVATDAFTETGGMSALSAAASTQSLTFTTVGVRLASAGGSGPIFRGMAGWRHAFGNVTPLSSMTLQGQTYAVAGVPIAANAFVAEAGVDVPVSTNLTLSASYAGQISANSQDHGGRATATLKF